MDPTRFDTLAKALATAGTRRGVVRLLAALPVAASFAAWLSPDGVQGSGSGAIVGGGSRRRRRKAKPRHQSGNNKEHRKRKGKGKGKRTGCKPQSAAQTCAGKCAIVTNNCGKPVDCGPCTCATGCPQCQSCNPATGLCGNLTDGTTCDDGNPCTENAVCTNGVCGGGTVVANRTVCGGSGTTTAICCNGTCWDGCCGVDGAPSACTVFATADPRFTGNLGGLSGADAICQTRAMAGGLPGAEIAGTYKAWLSTGTGTGQNPLTRFRHSGQPYVLPDGAQVADDWTDLTTCESGPCLDHAIDVSESGGTVSLSLVWTNTASDGGEAPGPLDCDDWASESSVRSGRIGQTNLISAFWTQGVGIPCSSLGRLYCFQQD